MGCGSSSESSPKNKGRGRSHSSGRRPSSIRRWSLIRKHKVSVKVGDGISCTENFPKIIFIFGGPGSKKGLLLDNLGSMFGCVVINVERIILEDLAKKVDNANPSDMTRAICDHLKLNPSALTLDMVMGLIAKRIEADPKKIYLVDFMPNLKFLLRISTFIKECSVEMNRFEKTHKVSFAMQLSLPLTKLLKKKETECAKHPMGSAESEKTQPSSTGGAGGGVSATGGKSDEADVKRTEKRATLFETTVQPFLDYFRQTDRLAVVDVSCALIEPIFDRTVSLFQDLDMEHVMGLDTCILFAFNERHINTICPGNYDMKTVSLDEIIYDTLEPFDKVIKSICKFVDMGDPLQKCFCIDVSNSSLTKTEATLGDTRLLVFKTMENVKLENHIAPNQKDTRCSIKFKSIITGNGETLLFPEDTSSLLAKRIAVEFVRGRE